MRINPVQNSFSPLIRFTNNPKSAAENNIEHDKENPISKRLEQLDVVKASIIAGLGFGARALYYIFDDTDLLDYTFDKSQQLAQKNYGHIKNGFKRGLLGAASFAAMLIGVVGLLAGLYAIYNAPKSMYQGKINAHKKSEEMDVYLAGNRVEQDLYAEVSKQAKSASTVEEQEKVKQQYLLLNAAKNQTPAFVDFKSPI